MWPFGDRIRRLEKGGDVAGLVELIKKYTKRVPLPMGEVKRAMRALVTIGSQEAARGVLQFLSGPVGLEFGLPYEVHDYAVRAVRGFGSSKAIEYFASSLDDAEYGASEAAILALEQFEPGTTLRAFLRAFSTGTRGPSRGMHALAKLRDYLLVYRVQNKGDEEQIVTFPAACRCHYPYDGINVTQDVIQLLAPEIGASVASLAQTCRTYQTWLLCIDILAYLETTDAENLLEKLSRERVDDAKVEIDEGGIVDSASLRAQAAKAASDMRKRLEQD
jgi:hypothetical protein